MRKSRTISVFVGVNLLPLFFALQTHAQSPVNQTPVSDTDAHPSAQPAPASTLDLGRDAQFISLIHARDGQVSHLAELKRILSFHDGVNASFQKMWNSFSVPDYKCQIVKEQKRLERFSQSISQSTQISDKQSLANSFDDDFPLRIGTRSPFFERSGLRSSRVTSDSSIPQDIALFITSERASIQNFFQTLSVETRTYSTKYEAILADLEGQARRAFQPPQTPTLNEMPDSFSDLAGAASNKDMTAEQISAGIESYKSALSEAAQVVTSPTSDQINRIHDSIIQKLTEISNDIRKEYADSAKSFDEFERGIVKTATVTFGNAIGSSSFTYLLVVFASVFVMIMLFPVLYKRFDSTVATNLIKSEFLLQLSTVFVLTSAIIILGIGQFIDRQQLPVLLASISGYVLGQLGKA
jgi:hypothetical protein